MLFCHSCPNRVRTAANPQWKLVNWMNKHQPASYQGKDLTWVYPGTQVLICSLPFHYCGQWLFSLFCNTKFVVTWNKFIWNQDAVSPKYTPLMNTRSLHTYNTFSADQRRVNTRAVARTYHMLSVGMFYILSVAASDTVIQALRWCSQCQYWCSHL